MKKRVIFITQSKGGVGKSVITFLYAQKYPDAVFLDMDDATKTTMKQLSYLDPKQVSFLSENKSIDRGKFNDFLEQISTHKKDLFICDLGSSISEQLPFYINDFNAELLKNALIELGIEMQLICVVGGQNIFSSCMEYLQTLDLVVKSHLKISVALNDHFALGEIQRSEFDNFCKKNNLNNTFHFNLSKDKNASTQDRVTSILKEGKGLSEAGIITKQLFKTAINNLPEL